MQKIIFITILLGFTVAMNNQEFSFEDLNNKKLFENNFDICIAILIYASQINIVILIVNYDLIGSNVNSFKFTREQVDNNCNRTLTYYLESSTENTFKYLNKQVSLEQELIPKHTFFSQYRSKYKDGKLIWDAVFTVLISKKDGVYVNLGHYTN